jgi:hypothetical protein
MLMHDKDDAFAPPYPEVLNCRVKKQSTDAEINGREGVVQENNDRRHGPTRSLPTGGVLAKGKGGWMMDPETNIDKKGLVDADSAVEGTTLTCPPESCTPPSPASIKHNGQQ